MSFYRKLVLIGFLIWLAENFYFGWNEKPQSIAERVFDMVSITMVFWGIIGDVLQNVHFQKFNTTHNNINTKTVEIKNAVVKAKKKNETA